MKSATPGREIIVPEKTHTELKEKGFKPSPFPALSPLERMGRERRLALLFLNALLLLAALFHLLSWSITEQAPPDLNPPAVQESLL
ncbi:MAG: hypothetical protein GX130_05185 [Candidatus Hydrogenedens sp.]|nr:hypothetical protein [Candidatus Hydrogenedens sp.]